MSARRLATALLAALALAGCSDQPVGTFDRAAFLVQSVPQARMQIAFVPASPVLEPGEAARLAGFLQGLALGNVHDVHLTFVSSGNGALDRDRVEAATRAVQAAGVPSRIHIVSTREAERLDRRSNIVLVESLSAGQLLVACPRTYRDGWEEEYAARVPRLGCANAANLAHMAERPRDLVAPRPLGPADAATSAAAVARHRAGQVTPPPPLAAGR